MTGENDKPRCINFLPLPVETPASHPYDVIADIGESRAYDYFLGSRGYSVDHARCIIKLAARKPPATPSTTPIEALGKKGMTSAPGGFATKIWEPIRGTSLHYVLSDIADTERQRNPKLASLALRAMTDPAYHSTLPGGKPTGDVFDALGDALKAARHKHAKTFNWGNVAHKARFDDRVEKFAKKTLSRSAGLNDWQWWDAVVRHYSDPAKNEAHHVKFRELAEAAVRPSGFSTDDSRAKFHQALAESLTRIRNKHLDRDYVKTVAAEPTADDTRAKSPLNWRSVLSSVSGASKFARNPWGDILASHVKERQDQATANKVPYDGKVEGDIFHRAADDHAEDGDFHLAPILGRMGDVAVGHEKGPDAYPPGTVVSHHVLPSAFGDIGVRYAKRGDKYGLAFHIPGDIGERHGAFFEPHEIDQFIGHFPEEHQDRIAELASHVRGI